MFKYNFPIDVISVDATLALIKHSVTGAMLGAVARGELWEDSRSDLHYRQNHRWYVVGWEHQKFPSMRSAVEALRYQVFNAQDAQLDLRELRISESFLPLYRRAARRQKTTEARTAAKRLKEQRSESKLNYHDSLKHAGYSKFIY